MSAHLQMNAFVPFSLTTALLKSPWARPDATSCSVLQFVKRFSSATLHVPGHVSNALACIRTQWRPLLQQASSGSSSATGAGKLASYCRRTAHRTLPQGTYVRAGCAWGLSGYQAPNGTETELTQSFSAIVGLKRERVQSTLAFSSRQACETGARGRWRTELCVSVMYRSV
jgi:hypothetical protein